MMMTRRDRLLATLRGEAVDRPPVSFYELNGIDEDLQNPDPFNIYSHPSWEPLINLTKEKTDRIALRGVIYDSVLPDPIDSMAEIETKIINGSLITIKKIHTGSRILTARTRKDCDINTIWTEEFFLKDVDDLKALINYQFDNFGGLPDLSKIDETEKILGDTGIVLCDMPDPLCLAGSLFDLGIFSEIAYTETALFEALMDKFAEVLYPRVEYISKNYPGRLWRIYGPELASAPILPPNLFKELVVKYDTPIINLIKKYGGYARIHSHGNLKNILDHIIATGADALDPIEPPPQGDVELSYIREKYGKQLVLFGNLEISDIENLPTERFAEKVKRSVDEGTKGLGRGFVLMPSAAPYGRYLSSLTVKNYEKIIEVIESL
jgi:hypothetical protein